MASSLAVYRIVQLPESGTVKAVEGRRRHRRGGDRSPLTTRMKITGKSVARGWSEARIVHREARSLTAVWHEEVVHEVVLQHRVRAFYNRSRELFAIDAGRDVARPIVDRLNGVDGVELRAVRLDLAALLDALPEDGTVLGAWSATRRPAGIRSRAVFGDDLASQAEFRRMCETGEISSLRLHYPFDRTSIGIGVSRGGSVRVSTDVNLETRLRLVQHLVADFEAEPRRSRAAATGK